MTPQNNLTKELSSFELTDELISINKHYQKLDKLHEHFETLIESFKDVDDDSKELKVLEKMQDKICKEMRKISADLRNEQFLQKMVKAAVMLKAYKYCDY
jgi:valyl-tRNA synthetase